MADHTDTKQPTTLPSGGQSDAIVQAPTPVAAGPMAHDEKANAATSHASESNAVTTAAAPPDYYSTEKPQETHAQPSVQEPSATSQPAQGQLVTPLWHLKNEPAWVDCPKCKTQTLTRINREAGSQATLWGVIICLVCGPCCAWIPCVMKSCKDTLHYCSRCDLPLAISKANGSVEVAQPAVAMQPSQFAYQPPANELKNATPQQAPSAYAPGAQTQQQQQNLPEQPTPMHTNAV